ncbi:MAG TPA: hypothetical protein PLA92_01840 [Fimbriimonadaceae bacterium]|nr:hypothetical protein [Fimbriimonadaceae bacterium]
MSDSQCRLGRTKDIPPRQSARQEARLKRDGPGLRDSWMRAIASIAGAARARPAGALVAT